MTIETQDISRINFAKDLLATGALNDRGSFDSAKFLGVAVSRGLLKGDATAMEQYETFGFLMHNDIVQSKRQVHPDFPGVVPTGWVVAAIEALTPRELDEVQQAVWGAAARKASHPKG
jgi:hypothetical protein